MRKVERFIHYICVEAFLIFIKKFRISILRIIIRVYVLKSITNIVS